MKYFYIITKYNTCIYKKGRKGEERERQCVCVCFLQAYVKKYGEEITVNHLFSLVYLYTRPHRKQIYITYKV